MTLKEQLLDLLDTIIKDIKGMTKEEAVQYLTEVRKEFAEREI